MVWLTSSVRLAHQLVAAVRIAAPAERSAIKWRGQRAVREGDMGQGLVHRECEDGHSIGFQGDLQRGPVSLRNSLADGKAKTGTTSPAAA